MNLSKSLKVIKNNSKVSSYNLKFIKNPNTMLLLRNPISSTKKLLRKTLHTLKSLFSPPTYHKLPKTSNPRPTLNPKTPPPPPQSSSHNNISNNNDNKTIVVSSSSSSISRPSQDPNRPVTDSGFRVQKNGKKKSHKASNTRERRGFVEQKLRELEKVDVGNIDHKLDIEEVLHYYSRLTCQPYVQIVDTFFMEVFAEFSEQTLKPIRE